ncbi:MAG TPA: hypothetical protein H9780_03935 [Candidatus Mediterraneibacter merdavium]|nr:hypothetical protein [Candidatus Mediterraneibacter merdavium]
MEKKAKIITDKNDKKIVVLPEILFKGKRSLSWNEVKNYLKQYVGKAYEIAETKDIVYIGNDLPNEYTGSKYTYKLKGTVAKAKANAAQGIPELIEISTGRYHRENTEQKHYRNARFGWYRYDSRFALPVYDESGKLERYNIFHASLIIRHSEDNRLYLYDIIDIKKETSTPLES